MRYHVLAIDYDGTIAHNGRVNASTQAALERLRASGRRLILVTGRELDELLTIFPEVQFFDWIVAENGALLYRPANSEEILLAEAPPKKFVDELMRRGVKPLAVGRVIVATQEPNEQIVLEAIRDLGLELQVIFNKGAVMVLPASVNKMTGLSEALARLHLSPHETVGAGDAENDHAFLSICEFSAATANAIPSLKQQVDLVTSSDDGEGVSELIEQLIDNDLQVFDSALIRHQLLLGERSDKTEVYLSPNSPNILIAGPSGSGKSTTVFSILERLSEKKYQVCIVDPEGDYEVFNPAIVLGSHQHIPNIDEIMAVLEDPNQNAVVSLIGMRLADRPPFFVELVSRLLDMRTKTGRPHWIVVDEAHHLMPATWEPGTQIVPTQLQNMLFVTVHPDQVNAVVLGTVGNIIAVGAAPDTTIQDFCAVLQQAPPAPLPNSLSNGNILLWRRQENIPPFTVKLNPSTIEQQRHSRKYAEGKLPPDRSFYFRGSENKMNLRAQNLMLFQQLAEGVDEDTWLFHLRAHDYSKWFRDNIKNPIMADEAKLVEMDMQLSSTQSRKKICELIERYYTLPTSTDLPIPGTDADPEYPGKKKI